MIQASGQIDLLHLNLGSVDLESKGRGAALLQGRVDVIAFYVFNRDRSAMFVHEYDIVVILHLHIPHPGIFHRVELGKDRVEKATTGFVRNAGVVVVGAFLLSINHAAVQDKS
jgi:hypothetical protein